MLPVGEGSSLGQGRMEAGRMGMVAVHKRPAEEGIRSRHTEAAPADANKHQVPVQLAHTEDRSLAIIS